MTLPSLYLSRPAIVMPDAALDNDAVLSRVRESLRGSASEWAPIEQGIQYVFDRCTTKL
jgi:3-oxoacyl-[acyl-carrier-protein] synthase-3